jgi:hypothetical protein
MGAVRDASEASLDEEIAASFPASDPPSWTTSTAIAARVIASPTTPLRGR